MDSQGNAAPVQDGKYVSAGFKDQYIEAAEILTHSHGAEGEHAHEALAFTTWIDFSLAAKQAKAIAQALSRKKT